MPLSWDPRRMWPDNPSVAGTSKDIPNEEIVTDSSLKPVPTAFAGCAGESTRQRSKQADQ
ncbi:hypothetical protein N7516_001941 [Penicillium verrucosum]|uniref:uncharacterized protein n=1 Tax=Penicillium verrucosum TaxID=60171 RepID=UPI00254579EC|nr:uncharacterized protein N7516_001941 [Penicillium verrucosum]KAJ5941773.1 hypothetical protein N7516_001941 [Penicillium verrucosum]